MSGMDSSNFSNQFEKETKNKNQSILSLQQQKQYAQQKDFDLYQNVKNYQINLNSLNNETIPNQQDYEATQNDSYNMDSYNKQYCQENLMTEQDLEGHQHNEDSQDQDASESQYRDIEKQEENISRSDEDDCDNFDVDDGASLVQNVYSDRQEPSHHKQSAGSGYIGAERNNTGYSNKSQQVIHSTIRYANEDTDKKVIVERNDKFIIYKMVPQYNKNSASTNQIHSQPTPVIRKQAFEVQNKGYSESVEDVNESSEEEKSQTQSKFKNQKHQDKHFFFDNNSQEDDEFDDAEFLKYESKIESEQNQDKSSFGLRKQGTVSDKIEVQTKTLEFMGYQNNSVIQQDDYSDISQVDGTDTRKRSILSAGRQSSEKFGKPHKIQMKKVADDEDDLDMNFTKTIQLDVGQMVKANPEVVKSKIDNNQNVQSNNQPQLGSRKQSVNTALRTSQMKNEQPQAQPPTQKQTAQHQTDINSQYSSSQQIKRPQKKSADPEQLLLQQEYMKLKQTLGKMEKTKAHASQQQTIERSRSKNQHNSQTQSVTQTQQKPPKETLQKKYRKNMELNTFEHNNEVVDQYLSCDSSKEVSDTESNNFYQKSLCRRSLTPTSITKKNAMKQKQQMQYQQQRETTKAGDGQNKMKALKSQLGSFREAVEATRSKSIRQTTQKQYNSKHQNSTALTQKGSPKRNNLVRGGNNNFNQQQQIKIPKAFLPHTRQGSKYNDRKSQQMVRSAMSNNSSQDNKSQITKKHQQHGEKSVRSRVAYKKTEQKTKQKSLSKRGHNKKRQVDSDYDDQEQQSDEDDGSRTSSQELNYHVNKHNARNSQSSYYSGEDSIEYSDSQDSDQDYTCKQSRKNVSKSKKGKINNLGDKSRSKDRKLKININMNGHRQFSRQQRQEMHLSQDQYLQQQRQLMQQQQQQQHQQQYLMSLAQYPGAAQHHQSQAYIIQQQQHQQQLYNPHQIHHPQHMGIHPHHPQPIQPINVVYQGLHTQAPMMNNYLMNHHSVAQIQPQTTVNEQKQNIIFFGGIQNNSSNISNTGSSTTRQQPLIQQQQLTYNDPSNLEREYHQIGRNLSDKSLLSQIAMQNNNNNIPSRVIIDKSAVQSRINSRQNFVSPRDHSNQKDRQLNLRQNDDQASFGPNYLNQLQNRFKASNQNSDIKTSRNMSQQHMQQSRSSPPRQDDNNQGISWLPSARQQHENVRQDDDNRPTERFRDYNMHQAQFAKKESFNNFMDDDRIIGDHNVYANSNILGNFTNKNENQPLEQAKVTGQFGYSEVDNKFRALNKQQKSSRQISRDPSANLDRESSGNMSMDEGVQIGDSHGSIVKSPKISSEFRKLNDQPKSSYLQSYDSRFKDNDSQLFDRFLSKKSSIQLQSNQSQQNQTYQDKNQDLPVNKQQDKKGPQAIFIGFEDESVADPFSKKPALKQRQPNPAQNLPPKSSQISGQVGKQNNNTTARSQSSKGNLLQRSETVKESNSMQGSKQQNSITVLDKQLRSPQNAELNKLDTFTKSTSPQKQTISKAKAKQDASKDNYQVQEGANQKQIMQQNDQKASFTEFELDPSDPSHNQDLIIEIFDKKSKIQSKPQEVSLADMFLQKKKNIAEKLENRKNQGGQDQDAQDLGQDDQYKEIVTEQPKQRTKKDILEQRKLMMKSKVTAHQNNFDKQQELSPHTRPGSSKPPTDNSVKNNRKEPSVNVMQRLAQGQKTKVDRQEMKKLTNKNFQNLPEIKKKKEDEKKKEELQARKDAAQDYAKKLDDKRRANILKKKKSAQFDK